VSSHIRIAKRRARRRPVPGVLGESGAPGVYEPVGGVAVELHHVRSELAPMQRPDATSGDDGRFTMGDQDAGQYDVAVWDVPQGLYLDSIGDGRTSSSSRCASTAATPFISRSG